MTKKNPIKFLDPYTKNDLDIFFGREKESNTLYEKINQAKVVLLYGLSGTGKTSLIQCGLENKCQNDHLTFLYIRRGKNLIDSIRNVVEEKADSLIHPEATPRQALETLYYDHLTPLLVVFDQFEELFISGDDDEKEKFIQAFYEILQSNIKVKFIISLREEYLAYLDDFEKEIPTLFNSRYRVERMRRNTLEEVIISITKEAGIELENEKIPGLIFENLPLKMGFIELPDLQVYLDELKLVAKSLNSDLKFTDEIVNKGGKRKDVLLAFLNDQLEKFEDDKTFAESVLKQLITEEGTKKQLYISDFTLTDGADKTKLSTVLEAFRTSKIIKFSDGVYELSHDSLAKKVKERKTDDEKRLDKRAKLIEKSSGSGNFLKRDQLIDIKPYYEKLNDEDKEFFDDSKKKANWKLWGKVALVSIFVILIVSSIVWFLRDKKRDYDKELIVNATFAKKIKNALYFYDNRIALSFNGKEYGFVDTLANPISENVYDKASHINIRTSQALCYSDNDPYLIDAREDTFRELLLVNLSNFFNLFTNPIYIDKIKAADLIGGTDSLSTESFDKLLIQVFELSQLQILVLTANSLDTFPNEIINLTNLRDLQIQNNQIKKLPHEIGVLKNLTYLNVSNNLLNNLPHEIGDLKNLTYLNVSGNLLDSLPPDIGNLSNLKTLDLSNNPLTKLPPKIDKLSKLESLYISDYAFDSLIKEIQKLKKIESLKKLVINSGYLSNEEEKKIRDLLPGCQVNIVKASQDPTNPSSSPPSSPPSTIRR